jgi:hypothetical protein
MTIVRDPIALSDLAEMAKAQFGDLVKAVVDDAETRKAIVAAVARLVTR